MFSKLLIDVLLVGIVIIGAVLGIKRGFIKSLSKPVKAFASLFIAFSLCASFSASVLAPMIEAPLTAQITDFLASKCADIGVGETERLPTLIKFAAVLVDVDIATIEATTSEGYIALIVEKLATPVVSLISVVISFFLLYFLSKLVFAIAFAILNHIFSNGFFGAVNKTLGFIFNTAFFFIIAWTLVLIIDYAFNAPMFDGVAWIRDFEGGFVFNLFKRISPVDLLLSF